MSTVVKPSKQPLYLFLMLVTVFAALSYMLAFAMGDDNRTGGLLLVQFSPMLAAFITKFAYQRNIRGLGWGWGETRIQLKAYVTPFFLALVSFSLVWLFGFGELALGTFVEEAREGIADLIGVTLSSSLLILSIVIVINGTVGMLVGFGAIGEELGWRGFLVPELFKHYSYTKTSFISGTIWAVYHYPLLIVLMAPRLDVLAWPLLISTLIGGIALTFILNWFRIRSGSVWAAVLFHAALNIHNQGFFQNITVENSQLTNYISGEHGFMLAIVSAGAAYLFWRRRGDLTLPELEMIPAKEEPRDPSSKDAALGS
jgi:membrane protease YdiL (CAAX protease family)